VKEMDKSQAPLNIQDSYLAKARKERSWVTIFLNNGRKLSGRIRSFDRYTVILESHGNEQMIFKHAISTISIARTFGNTIDFEKEPGGTGHTGGEGPSSAGSGREKPPSSSGSD
jgi:host factor-I protein